MTNPNPYAPSQMPQGNAPLPPPPGAEAFAPCPHCGNVYAERVGFTLWGGALGPKMFHHVKCYGCGNCYNGKTGKSNATAIAIYVAVSLVLGIGIAVALGVLGVIG